mmetsp:Transcript_7117/g.23398  ORF Transcript_7117/g.23398 Transcript_7117/m.23398 type:complete len:219 (-) Transcript_7117:3457-4113(-)
MGRPAHTACGVAGRLARGRLPSRLPPGRGGPRLGNRTAKCWRPPSQPPARDAARLRRVCTPCCRSRRGRRWATPAALRARAADLLTAAPLAKPAPPLRTAPAERAAPKISPLLPLRHAELASRTRCRAAPRPHGKCCGACRARAADAAPAGTASTSCCAASAAARASTASASVWHPTPSSTPSRGRARTAPSARAAAAGTTSPTCCCATAARPSTPTA